MLVQAKQHQHCQHQHRRNELQQARHQSPRKSQLATRRTGGCKPAGQLAVPRTLERDRTIWQASKCPCLSGRARMPRCPAGSKTSTQAMLYARAASASTASFEACPR